MEVSVTFAGSKQGSIKLKGYLQGLKPNMERGLRAAGVLVERALKLELKDSNPTTFFAKSYNWRLASRTGTLRRSITHQMGRTAGGPNVRIGPGGYAAKYGAVHEFGAKIPVTERMRAFLHFKGVHLRKSTTEIVIPKREWFKPTVDKARPQIITTMERVIYKPIRGR